MKAVKLNNGLKMPTVGLGTYRLRSPTVEKVTEAALQCGYRLIDTAGGYKNEASIGEVLKRVIPTSFNRSDVFITSKMDPASHGTESARKAALNSISTLQLDYLDLYLIHWPGSSGIHAHDPQNAVLRKESWLALESLYEEKKLASIGVSNYTVSHLTELLQYCSIVPAVLQVEIHPYLIQKKLREFCEEHNIHVQAYSSLGSDQNQLLDDPVVQKVAKELNKTCAQVLLRWAVQQNMCVIPRTTKSERLDENFQLYDFCLSEEQMNSLNELDKDFHFCWNPQEIK